MKKYWKLNYRAITQWLVGWLAATNLLVLASHTLGWWPFKVLLFACITLLPGVTILRALRISMGSLTASIVYFFGLSILVLMLSGLAANQLLYQRLTLQPLNFWWCIAAWNIANMLLIAISYFANRDNATIKKLSLKRFSKLVWFLAILSAFLPCLAAFGAFRLNNGGDGLIAGLALCLAAIIILATFIMRRRLPDGLLAWCIFSIGLTVLLMTSLRGWDIVGHDIEREFRVYTLTQQNNHWDIRFDRQPYNACLSITILPQMFAQILGVSGYVVFKLILQIVFAMCPVVLFMLLRQYLSRIGALVGCMLFISYPTFINDSAMMTRQGVAYLFFALALVVISNRAQKKRYKLLFMLCATGAILSHYSTAYMFVALFAVAVGCKLCITGWYWIRRKKLDRTAHGRRTVLSPLFAVLVFLVTFVWYAQVTETAGGLSTTLKASVANIPKLFSADDNKSSDTSGALLFSGGKTQADLYQTYLTNTLQTRTVNKQIQYLPALTSDDLPITNLGKKAQTVGLDPSLITTLRQNFAKVLQLLAVAGSLYVAFMWLFKKSNKLEGDYICLSLAGIVLLALMVALPILSVNYGILRAFQQGLIFLILPMTLLLAWLFRRVNRWFTTAISATGTVLLFLLFTGFFAQLLGGTSPGITMNNTGLYYGLFYSTKADQLAFSWLKQHLPKNADVRAANFIRAGMHYPDYPFSRNGILPSQISSKSFMYLDPSQTRSQLIYTYFESSPLIMILPENFYDTNKNKLYSTTSTGIYH